MASDGSRVFEPPRAWGDLAAGLGVKVRQGSCCLRSWLFSQFPCRTNHPKPVSWLAWALQAFCPHLVLLKAAQPGALQGLVEDWTWPGCQISEGLFLPRWLPPETSYTGVVPSLLCSLSSQSHRPALNMGASFLEQWSRRKGWVLLESGLDSCF